MKILVSFELPTLFILALLLMDHSQVYRCCSSFGGFASSKSEHHFKRARVLCVLPCTVSQLKSATQHKDSFFIQGMEINQVTVVGLIRRTVPAVTHVVYCLDDMTGSPLDVKLWMDIELRNDDLNDRVIPPGTYVRVVGNLRSFEHHRSMVAFSIRRTEDLNEITSHMLEVVQAHLLGDGSCCRLKKNAMTSSIMEMSHAGEPSTFGFTASQSQVFNLIKSCPTAEGVSMQNLSTALNSLSPYDIRSCLQFLLNEGHIFSTIDDYHFKSL